MFKYTILSCLVLSLALTLSGCGQPTPQIVTVVETVVVKEEAEPVTPVTVVETVEVVKEVEKIVTVEVTPGPDPIYTGLEATLLTGTEIVAVLERHAADFELATGAVINIESLPEAELSPTILDDLSTSTNRYQGFVFDSQNLVDYAAPGYLLDLTERVESDESLAWPDMAPFFREVSARYDQVVYSLPLDGDFLIVYYRPDVLEEIGMRPPQTWDDYLEIAGTANGLDFNADGSGDYGSCLPKAEGHWVVAAIAGGYLQVQGTDHGLFFDPESFEPLVNNTGFRRALEIYKESARYGPPDDTILTVEQTRELMLAGRCALTLDWGAIGSLAVQAEQSVIQDKLAAVILPGSPQVVDRVTGDLVECDEDLCPYALDGVNHAPLAASGGWAGAINAAADEEVQTVVYEFLTYVSAPAQANVDVTLSSTGLNPYRTSQFLNRQPWVEAGLSPAAATAYLNAVEQSLSSPNMVLDLRVPGRDRYQIESLSSILDRYVADELSTEAAVAEIFERWEMITQEIGREDQRLLYRRLLGTP